MALNGSALLSKGFRFERFIARKGSLECASSIMESRAFVSSIALVKMFDSEYSTRGIDYVHMSQYILPERQSLMPLPWEDSCARKGEISATLVCECWRGGMEGQADRYKVCIIATARLEEEKKPLHLSSNSSTLYNSTVDNEYHKTIRYHLNIIRLSAYQCYKTVVFIFLRCLAQSQTI